MPDEMTRDELLALPTSVDLVTAGRAFGLSRTQCYDLARRGQFPCPTLRVGRLYKVPRTQIFRALGMDESSGRPAATQDEAPAPFRLDRPLSGAEVAALEAAAALFAKALVRGIVEQMSPPR